jgi:hypothetical protein
MSNISDRAAEIMKIVMLARNPMMDRVAIQLAREPTYDEKQRARQWEKAFKIASTEDMPITIERLSEIWGKP